MILIRCPRCGIGVFTPQFHGEGLCEFSGRIPVSDEIIFEPQTQTPQTPSRQVKDMGHEGPPQSPGTEGESEPA